jgi:hypothetical protein
VDRLPEDPVVFWLGRLDAASVPVARNTFNRWMRWLHSKPGYQTVTPRELLVSQIQADDPYVLVDLLQEFIGSLHGRKASKQKAHWAVSSFFTHNRCALQKDPSFKIRGDKPPVEGRLTVTDIQEAIHAATLRYRAVILFKWQSFLDNERLMWANKNCTETIVDQMKKGIMPVRLDMPGRKEMENDTSGKFCTFLGRDAVDALTAYFDEERGHWPKRGEPLIIQKDGQPLYKPTVEATWLRLMRRMGKVPRRKGPLGTRYGYNLHEMRDVAASYLHVTAKGEGLDMDCIKLWSGRVGDIDPNNYDKFYQDTDYITKQYLIAEKYLNIISGKPAEQEHETKQLQSRVDYLEHIVHDLQTASGLRVGSIKPEG